jgi:hypothetical protein
MESDQVLKQAQRFLNLKKNVQPELHDFKIGLGLKKNLQFLKNHVLFFLQKNHTTLVSTYLSAILVTNLPSLRGQ